jgi:hypothetical protein
MTPGNVVQGYPPSAGVIDRNPRGGARAVCSEIRPEDGGYLPDMQGTGLVCGTLIKTVRGEEAVEDLIVGDLVLSPDSGYRPVVRILSHSLTRIEMLKAPHLWPVKIAAGALGQGMPERDLLVSQQHLVLLSSKLAAEAAGHREILIPAKTLLGLPGVSLAVPAAGAKFHQIGFAQHELIWTNGVLTGSLVPGAGAMKRGLPAGSPGGAPATRAARAVVQDNSVILPLIFRHARSGVPLVDHG